MKKLICAVALISMSCVFADAKTDKTNYHGAYVAIGGGAKRVKQSFSASAVAEDVTREAGNNRRAVVLLNNNSGTLLADDGAGGEDPTGALARVLLYTDYDVNDPVGQESLKNVAVRILGDYADLNAIPADKFYGVLADEGRYVQNVGAGLGLIGEMNVIEVESDDIVLKGGTKTDVDAMGIFAFGYNHRSGDVVVGLEAFLSVTKNAKIDYGICKVSEMGTSPGVKLKLGYVFGEVLCGGTVGVTVHSNRFSACDKNVTKTCIVPVVGAFVQKNVYKNLDISLNVDYRFNKNVSVNYSGLSGGIGANDKFDPSVNNGINIFNKVKVSHKASGGWRANLMLVYNIH